MRRTLSITLLCTLLCTPGALASPAFNEANIIKALAGEAGGQGMDEIEAHAHAINNRGHLGGVYGIRRPAGVRGLERARIGLKRSITRPDSTHGATHWLSDYDLRHSKPRLTAFRFKMVETAYIGETHFYKERG